MLRILTIASLFPDATRPGFGGFVARQTCALAALPDTDVTVIAPLGLPPLLGRRHPRWRALAALPAREAWAGLDVHRPRFPIIPGLGAAHGPLLAARLLPYVARLHRRLRFDVIDAEFFYPDGPAAIAIGRRLGLPVSIKARGGDIHYWGRHRGSAGQVRRAGRAADGLLAVSAALKTDMVALGMPEARILVHYTGVDLARFRPPADRAAAKRSLGLEGPVLLSVGALIARKGHDLAIAALPRLPGATLLIAGEGPEAAALRAQAERLGVADRVRLLGRQPHEALPALHAAADVGLLASASEGLANAWVESLACGVPLVISEAGGARELLDRPEAGRIVARTPEAIAAAVAALLADPPAPETVRAAAERFTWPRNAARLRAHLAGLVAARGG
ncbi:glycosyltransferase [Sphingomonas morindae]|uniref:Glycosyltransferase n=1 Tax=Sphingomonas morindae TaxID=1541170 RepID=A0ABY4XA89_9SPHN|nr:glycosyltransferase [Sphingomonas morindae]USI73788.1 glycosyltransferase [Sphingomonas morindae]